MKITDIMSKPVVCVSPDSSIQEAAKKMEENNIGDVPVCSNERLIGILTDRDIVVRACSKGMDINTTKVKDIMTHGIEWCLDDEDIEKIVRKMESKAIQRMIVIDHNKKLIGIVSLADIAVRADDTMAAEALHHISELRRGRRNM